MMLGNTDAPVNDMASLELPEGAVLVIVNAGGYTVDCMEPGIGVAS